MYNLKITRLERILENGAPTGLVIGVTYERIENGKVVKSAYTDWTAKPEDFTNFPPSEVELHAYIEDYLTDCQAGMEGEVTASRLDSLRAQVDTPVVTREAEPVKERELGAAKLEKMAKEKKAKLLQSR